MRSILTVLGITIGIAAVICVVAIGRAGQVRVEQQLNNLGDNFVWIEAGGRAVNGVRTGPRGTKTLTLGDAFAIRNQIPLIKSVSPNADSSSQVIDEGAPFTQDDVDRAAGVCVIGATIRSQLFGAANPIGQVIRLKTLPCKVVATLKPKGLSISGQDQDDTILLPYS